jgi:DNA replication protein DnaC
MLGWGASAEAFRGTEFARHVVTKALSGELDDWLAMLMDEELWYLFLDDFDKIKFTPKVTECIYEVFEARFSHGLPILLTVNSTGTDLEQKMPPEYGSPIVRRIRDHCSPVKFYKP